MKIRQGFVSNSSSSSFLVVTTTENYNAALKKATPLQKVVVEKINKEKEKVFGKDCIVMHTTSSDEGHCTRWFEEEIDASLFSKKEYEDEYEKYQELEDAWDAFCELLSKNKNEYFSHYERS